MIHKQGGNHMNRWTVLLAIIAVVALVALGCSGGGESPVMPDTGPAITDQSQNTGQTQTHLWGYYDLYFDFENQTVEAVPNHNAMFTANVVQFVNGNPANLGFGIHGTPVGVDYIDVDIDVSITHPFPGIHQYDGYDVRGVFMGEGSESLSYGSNLDYASLVTDQHMKDYNPEGLDDEYVDPYDAPVGNPDGYTRWFNADEFIGSGPLGYTQGKLATPGYVDKLTATLNPYKYFCDGLDVEDDAWEWLTTGTNSDGHGLFSAGATNTRNYYLRFPVPTPGVSYGYAILATWGEPGADDDPADFVENAVEAVALSVDLTDDIYYVDGTDNGGDFIADISPYNWEYAPSTILVETGVHSAVESFDPGATLVGGTETYSTYHVEFTVDDVTEAGYDEYWVVLEYGEYDYTCDYPAPAPDATLAAFFRYDLFIADTPYNADPICDLEVVTDMPASWYGDVPVEFDASGSYDPDPDDVLTYAWDFDGDELYDEDPDDAYDGDPWNPTHTYDGDYTGNVNLMLTDGNGGEATCFVEVEVEVKSCGTMTCPSASPTTMIGSNRIYYYNPEPTRASGTPRIVCAYSGGYYLSSINVTGTSSYFNTSNSYTIYNIAMQSDDTFFMQDSGSSTSLWTRTYDSSTGFGSRTSWGTAIPSGNYVHRLVVDEDDNPIVCARTSSGGLAVFHHDGTSWGSAINVPSSIMSEGGNSYFNFYDFDYDPTTGWYYFVERYNSAGVYAMDDTGTEMWSDNALWTQVNSTSYNPGIFIDKGDAECRMILMAGRNTSGQTTYWARFDPVGGSKVTGTTSGGTYGTTFTTWDGRGCVQISGSTARFLAATYGGNVWSSTIVPGW